ncbi:MAG: tRNA pseudouridine(55) synthase TruB [Candidatus Poribacteria bacterium]
MIINKSSGMTSHDVVIQIRRILNEKKVGHTGTLDPDAIGVLPICIGKATKIIQFLDDKDKCYEGTITLGIETDTMDASGKIIRISDSSKIEIDDIANILKDFIGEIEQIPPMVSAKKIKGKRLYKIARQGKTVERLPIKIRIYDLKLIKYYQENISGIDCYKNFTKFDFSVACSRGTYVRTLASDIGNKLGCGGHLSRLVRTRSGQWTIEESIKLDEIKNNPQIVHSSIISINDALSFMPSVVVNEIGKRKFINGVSVDITDILSHNKEMKADDTVRIHDNSGFLLGIGKVIQSTLKSISYKPLRVFAND